MYTYYTLYIYEIYVMEGMEGIFKYIFGKVYELYKIPIAISQIFIKSEFIIYGEQ